MEVQTLQHKASWKALHEPALDHPSNVHPHHLPMSFQMSLCPQKSHLQAPLSGLQSPPHTIPAQNMLSAFSPSSLSLGFDTMSFWEASLTPACLRTPRLMLRMPHSQGSTYFIICLPVCSPTKPQVDIKSNLLTLSPSAYGTESSHVELNRIDTTSQDRLRSVPSQNLYKVLWEVRESRVLLMDKSGQASWTRPHGEMPGRAAQLAASQ